MWPQRDAEPPEFLRIITVTIVRVGTTKKYADGWEAAFAKGKKKAAAAVKSAKKTAKKSTKAKPAKKKPAKRNSREELCPPTPSQGQRARQVAGLHRGEGPFNYARDRNSPVRVSTLIVSPCERVLRHLHDRAPSPAWRACCGWWPSCHARRGRTG